MRGGKQDSHDSQDSQDGQHDQGGWLRVVAAHEPSYPVSLIVQAGELLEATERVECWRGHPAWRWRWCTDARGVGGWLPEDDIMLQGDRATALRDYTSRELRVAPGEWVRAGRVTAGWMWCANERGETGWVPVDALEPREAPDPLEHADQQ